MFLFTLACWKCRPNTLELSTTGAFEPPSFILRSIPRRFAKEELLEVFPQYAEEDPLQSVGQDFGLESAEEQALDSGFFQHIADHLWVCELLGVRLFVHFHDTDRIAARVRHGRAAEPQQGSTSEFGQLCVLAGDLLGQIIVRGEPTSSGAREGE